jgi:hypothetical protein
MALDKAGTLRRIPLFATLSPVEDVTAILLQKSDFYQVCRQITIADRSGLEREAHTEL